MVMFKISFSSRVAVQVRAIIHSYRLLYTIGCRVLRYFYKSALEHQQCHKFDNVWGRRPRTGYTEERLDKHVVNIWAEYVWTRSIYQKRTVSDKPVVIVTLFISG